MNMNQDSIKTEVDAMNQHCLEQKAKTDAMACFMVVAGQLDENQEENAKFISDFVTFPEAVKLYDTCTGYHFAYIECQGFRITDWHNIPEQD